jgi:histone H3/H4
MSSSITVDHRPMLYAAEAIETARSLSDRLGRLLKERALDLTKRSGRKLVTADDVWAAFDSITKTDIYPDPNQEAGDG